jgi:hypothetical protein
MILIIMVGGGGSRESVSIPLTSGWSTDVKEEEGQTVARY